MNMNYVLILIDLFLALAIVLIFLWKFVNMLFFYRRINAKGELISIGRLTSIFSNYLYKKTFWMFFYYSLIIGIHHLLDIIVINSIKLDNVLNSDNILIINFIMDVFNNEIYSIFFLAVLVIFNVWIYLMLKMSSYWGYLKLNINKYLLIYLIFYSILMLVVIFITCKNIFLGIYLLGLLV